MAYNPYAQSWTTDGSPAIPSTKPGKNSLEPSGMTTRSPWEKVSPLLEQYLQRGPQNLSMSGSSISTAPVYGKMATANAADLSGLQSLLGSTGRTSASEKYLTDMASNANVDPYAQQAFQYQQNKLANSINDRFSAAGRYASGDYARALGDSLGASNAQFMSNQWNAARNRQLQATGMLDAAAQNRLGMQRGILGDIANLQGGNYDRKLAALGGQTAAQSGIDSTNLAMNNMKMGSDNSYWNNVFGLGNTYGTGVNYDVPTPLWQKLLGGGIGLLGAFGGMFK